MPMQSADWWRAALVREFSQGGALYCHRRRGQSRDLCLWWCARSDNGRQTFRRILDLLRALVSRQCAAEPDARACLPNLVFRSKRLRDWKPSRRHMEHFVVAVALVGLCWLTAATAERLPANSLLPAVLLLPLPLVLWAAVRFGEKGASSAILVVAVILTWRTLHGAGLFPSEGAERSVLAVQLFLTGL